MTATYLLGAGASHGAGIPVADALARIVHSASQGRVRAALDVAIGGISQRKARDGNPFGALEIEELYETLLLVADRTSNLLAPFVGSWSEAIEYADLPEPWTAPERLAYQLQSLLNRAAEGVSTEHYHRDELLQNIAAILPISVSLEVSSFKAAADFVLAEVLRLTKVTDASKAAYLAPLLRQSGESPWIATLNYDDTLEVVAANEGISVDFGIRNGAVSIPVMGTPDKVTLVKVHGSTNWMLGPDGELVVRSERPQSRTLDAGIIFGGSNKLRTDGPYLDLLLAFRSRLALTDILHVCGYSFRDKHINHLLLNWITGRDGKIFVHDPALTTATAVRDRINYQLPNRRGAIQRLEAAMSCDGLDAVSWLTRF